MADEHHSTATLIFASDEALKSLEVKADGHVRVGAYAIRFATAEEKDLTGDYFTKSTDFGPSCGNGVAALFNHGLPLATGVKALADVAEMTFGPVKTTKDDVGIFVEHTLDTSDAYQKAIAELCAQGKLKWSSGTAAHIMRKSAEGEVTRWHIAEVSYTPKPAEFRLPAIARLKSIEAAVGDDKSCLTSAIVAAFPHLPSAIGHLPSPAVDSTKTLVPTPTLAPTLMTPEEKAAAEKTQQDAIKSATDKRVAEVNEIIAIGEQFNLRDAAKSFIGEGKSLNDFRKHALEHGLKARPVDPNAGLVGMNRGEVKAYSLIKAIREMTMRSGLTGLEKEAHEGALKSLGRDIDSKGFIVPDDVLRGSNIKAQNVTTATAGGYLVPTFMGPMIELLRNKTRVAEAGATMLTGLTGDVMLPKHISGCTAYWVSETGALTDSQGVFGQVKLTPHRLGATIPYSTQFLAQASIDAESFIRADAVKVLAIEKDRAALHGTGVSGQPLGLANTADINQTVTYGGAPTWVDVVEHETGIADDNADIDEMAFILSVATVGKWKTTLKDSVAGAGYLITGSRDSMEANGYRALRTKQVSGNVSFFGAWSQLIIASWAGLEVIVDPYALKKSGQVEITFNELCDIVVRQPLAFNVSTDSAAQ